MSHTIIWGHRGAGFRGVENSMSSFKKAVNMGVDGIKTEAQLTSDGEIILQLCKITITNEGLRSGIQKGGLLLLLFLFTNNTLSGREEQIGDEIARVFKTIGDIIYMAGKTIYSLYFDIIHIWVNQIISIK